MGQATNILFNLIDIYNEQNQLYSIQGKVSSISESNRTCIVTPSDGGPDIPDVRLESNYILNGSSDSQGFFVVPSINSLVIITFLSKTDAFLSAWSTIDKIVSKQTEWIFNDGVNGGLTKLQELTLRLNELEDLFTELKNNFTAWTPIPSDGGAALKTILSSGYLTESIPDSKVSDFENTNVKH